MIVDIEHIDFSMSKVDQSDYLFNFKISKSYCSNCYNFINYPSKKTCNNCGNYNDKPIYLSDSERLSILRKEKIKNILKINECEFHYICALWINNKCIAVKCEFKK